MHPSKVLPLVDCSGVPLLRERKTSGSMRFSSVCGITGCSFQSNWNTYTDNVNTVKLPYNKVADTASELFFGVFFV